MTLEGALERIRTRAPNATAIDHWIIERDGETWFYVNDPPRDACAVGDIYTTWIVRVRADASVELVHYRSRVGAGGDDTLPP